MSSSGGSTRSRYVCTQRSSLTTRNVASCLGFPHICTSAVSDKGGDLEVADAEGAEVDLAVGAPYRTSWSCSSGNNDEIVGLARYTPRLRTELT